MSSAEYERWKKRDRYNPFIVVQSLSSNIIAFFVVNAVFPPARDKFHNFCFVFVATSTMLSHFCLSLSLPQRKSSPRRKKEPSSGPTSSPISSTKNPMHSFFLSTWPPLLRRPVCKHNFAPIRIHRARRLLPSVRSRLFLSNQICYWNLLSPHHALSSIRTEL